MSTPPRIKREVARDGAEVRYVYSFCSSCSYWHGFAWTMADAYAQAERHLINVHDLSARDASNARRAAEHHTRHANPTG